MPPGEFNDLGDLCFRDLEGEDAANAHTVAVDMQHHVDRFLAGLAENLFQDMDDELHRRVIVVQEQDLVEAWLLGLGACFGDDAGSGVASGISRPVLVVVVIVARILHCKILLRFLAYPNADWHSA